MMKIDLLDLAREDLIDSKARIKDIESYCYPSEELCTDECWQKEKYCIDPVWETIWEQLEIHPDKYWK